MSVSPSAVRVKKTSGWQDIAIVGPPGPPGLALAAQLDFQSNFTGAEVTGQASETMDLGGVGAVSGTDYQIIIPGTYLIFVAMYSINMNINTTAYGQLRLNPAGANSILNNAIPAANLSAAGANRYAGGTPAIVSLAAGDILRGRLGHSETGTVRGVGMTVTLVKVGVSAPLPLATDIYCQSHTGSTSTSIGVGAWTQMTLPAVGAAVGQLQITKSDGINDDFTRNADNSITINKAGNYQFCASIALNEPCPDGTNINTVISAKAGALPALGDNFTAFNETTGTGGNNYPYSTMTASRYCAVGDRVALYTHQLSGATRSVLLKSFSIVKTGAGPQGPPGPSTAIPLVATLPTSPVDGQEVYYLADATNGVVWHLRYRAGSISAYKWEFVGGSPLGPVINTGGAVSSATPVLLAGGPSLVLPLAGDYLIDHSADGYSSGATNNAVYSVLFVNGGNTSARMSMSRGESYRGGMGGRQVRWNAIGAGQTIDIRFQASVAAGGGAMENSTLSAIPVRVG